MTKKNDDQNIMYKIINIIINILLIFLQLLGEK